jgi:hypothetical protein
MAVADDMAHSVHDLGAPAIVQGDVQRDRLVVTGQQQRALNLLLELRVDAFQAPAV